MLFNDTAHQEKFGELSRQGFRLLTCVLILRERFRVSCFQNLVEWRGEPQAFY
jgi:hypothetical protein